MPRKLERLWESWKREPELDAEIPRNTSLVFRAKLWGRGWMVLGAAIVSGMLVSWELLGFWWISGFAVWMVVLVTLEGRRRRSKFLVSKGLAVCGAVVDWKEVEKGMDGGETYISHEYTVAYDLPDGGTLTFSEERLTRECYVGQKLTVLYLPQAPEEAILYETAVHRAMSRSPQINIVLNWFEELKERVPVP